MNFNKSSDYRLIFSLCILLNSIYCFNNITIAQTTISPYSRYGIGEIGDKGFAQSFSMGGTHIAMQNDSVPMFFINNGNPASYSNMRLVTAELGGNFNYMQLKSSKDKNSVTSASFGYLALAFPFKNWWGGSVGLVPFSSVGYKVIDEQNNNNFGSVKNEYEGTGGINQLYFGTGIKPFNRLSASYKKSTKYKNLRSTKSPDNSPKSCHEIYEDSQKIRRSLNQKRFFESLSLGVNASYLFGSMEHNRSATFPSNAYAFNTNTGSNTQVSGIYFDYGMQMAYTVDSLRYKDKTDTCRLVKFRDLKENVKILFGLTFASQTNVNATIDSLSYTYFNNSLGTVIGKDTIQYTTGTKGDIVLPFSIGFGFGIKKGLRWTFAGDVAFQNWSSYNAFGQTQGLKNGMRSSLGVQYIPDPRANAVYGKRINYRMGARYTQTGLELKSTAVNEYGLTIGLGFPVGRSFILQNFSMVNLGMELGQRGTLENGLIKENYFKVSIGFTINDKWFQQPKFD